MHGNFSGKTKREETTLAISVQMETLKKQDKPVALSFENI